MDWKYTALVTFKCGSSSGNKECKKHLFYSSFTALASNDLRIHDDSQGMWRCCVEKGL